MCVAPTPDERIARPTMSIRTPKRIDPSNATNATTGSVPPAEIVEVAHVTVVQPDPEAIDQLAARLGPSSEAEVAEIIGVVTDAALIAAGGDVHTDRITDDVVRIGGVAAHFFETASDEERANVKVSFAVLRALVWSAAQGNASLRTLRRMRAARRVRGGRGTTQHNATLAGARVVRDQLAESLRGVAGADPAELEGIALALAPASVGHSETGPGQSLASLIEIGGTMLASHDDGVASRRRNFGLTAAWLDACATKSTEALSAERALAAPAVASAAQQNIVDRWDGINLILADRVVRAFVAGNAIDGGVPRLAYVSLRGALGGHKARAKAAPKAPKNAAAQGGAKPDV